MKTSQACKRRYARHREWRKRHYRCHIMYADPDQWWLYDGPTELDDAKELIRGEIGTVHGFTLISDRYKAEEPK